MILIIIYKCGLKKQSNEHWFTLNMTIDLSNLMLCYLLQVIPSNWLDRGLPNFNPATPLTSKYFFFNHHKICISFKWFWIISHFNTSNPIWNVSWTISRFSVKVQLVLPQCCRLPSDCHRSCGVLNYLASLYQILLQQHLKFSWKICTPLDFVV